MKEQYISDLQALREQETHLAKEIGDQWRTPDWLFAAVNHLYGPLVVDLFTDGQNAKCRTYFTAEDNALTQDWGKALQRGADLCGADPMEPVKCFANPPYSIKRAAKGRKAPHLTGMTHIMAKAHAEHLQGVPSLWVTKSATSESWWPDELCSRIIHIKGRIGFDVPVWYRPDPLASETTSAGFGASVIIFDGESRHRFPEEYISRERLMEIGMPLAKVTEADRERWIKTWDEI
ncbi:MAG: phage N-6-adenine-methyltransferase [Cereibacter sphaeroides]|uniref:Phage N-6-adenine-methyltransferase n=1 Tax=Cereibacter sphaeroides TaxID=1063 RepID=A0A2W5RX10_CERSP|nr:MAG: phage N-6-adenine-methyltransferase [Cereibacter sphaeroides]